MEIPLRHSALLAGSHCKGDSSQGKAAPSSCPMCGPVHTSDPGVAGRASWAALRCKNWCGAISRRVVLGQPGWVLGAGFRQPRSLALPSPLSSPAAWQSKRFFPNKIITLRAKGLGDVPAAKLLDRT